MAITALDLPPDNRSAHDDLFVIATSDNANAVDFKYVFDVFANGKQLIRAKIYPNPDTSLGYFDISNVVANEMKFDWFVPNGQFFVKQLENKEMKNLINISAVAYYYEGYEYEKIGRAHV